MAYLVLYKTVFSWLWRNQHKYHPQKRGKLWLQNYDSPTHSYASLYNGSHHTHSLTPFLCFAVRPASCALYSISLSTRFLSLLISSLSTTPLPHSLQAVRTRTSEEFRSAKSGIMFSSDVTARGLDYPDVTLVLQVRTIRASVLTIQCSVVSVSRSLPLFLSPLHPLFLLPFLPSLSFFLFLILPHCLYPFSFSFLFLSLTRWAWLPRTSTYTDWAVQREQARRAADYCSAPHSKKQVTIYFILTCILFVFLAVSVTGRELDNLCLCPPVCRSVCVSICGCLSVYFFFSLSFCLFVDLFAYQFVYLSVPLLV